MRKSSYRDSSQLHPAPERAASEDAGFPPVRRRIG